MKFITSIVILFLAINLFGQSGFDETKISGETKKIVAKIEKINRLMGAAVGYSGQRPEQYENFTALQKTATREELIELTDYQNGVVRCYSFWALLYDRKTDMFPIVVKHIYDDALVSTEFGCISSREKVGDFFISLVTPGNGYSILQQLNAAELKQVDSLLIYTPNSLYARTEAINRVPLTESLYSRIRELIIKEKQLWALPVLAKFQKEQDIDLILNSRQKKKDIESGYHYTYQAIMNFPDPKFLPLLERNLQNILDDALWDSEWKSLYVAIAAYKNDKAAKLLNIPFTKVVHQYIKKYHLDFIYDAILEHKDRIYDDILWMLWDNNQNITLDGYKYYLKNNPGKTYAYTVKELTGNTIKKSKFIPAYDESVFTENLEETMLNLVFKNDQDLANQAIIYQIANADANSFPLYAARVHKSKETMFVEPLFKRLRTEDNPYVYIEIVNALISYQDNVINKQILETRKINPNLNKDWGSKNLDQVLKTYKIE